MSPSKTEAPRSRGVSCRISSPQRADLATARAFRSDMRPKRAAYLASDHLRIPSEDLAVGPHRRGEICGLSDIHPPVNTVGRIRLRQAPLALDEVHVDHLVAFCGIRLLVVLDEIRAPNVAAAPLPGRQDVVPSRAPEVRHAEVRFLPLQTVPRRSITREVAVFRRLPPFEDLRPVPHLEQAVFLIVEDGATQQADSGSSVPFPGSVGLHDWICLVTHGKVKSTFDPFSPLDH